jgi:hypothetical protein
MPPAAPTWLLLITNLPGRNPALRMRLWRALKATGAALLRDGAYLLPNGERSRQVLEEQGAEIKAAGGFVQILSFNSDSAHQNAELVALFNRTDDYTQAIERLETLKVKLAKLAEPQARQRLAGIAREVAAIAIRDFFPGEAKRQMEGALANAEAALNERFSPDEPHAANRKIRVRERNHYRARTWATRERLWIDRVASAWLIRRFIDPKAKFLWLKQVKDCPKSAVGFDFDGAEFTHVDCKVTYEVLLSSFNLEHDAGLTRLGALVHHLDVGGIPIAEAPGFAAIMAGARSLQRDDDELLKAMTPVLDSLYAGYAGADRKV